MYRWSYRFLVAAVLCGGCAHYEGPFIEKSEEDLDAMEQSAEGAATDFREGRFESAATAFRGLASDRTVSQPLYKLDLVPCLLLSGKTDEAYDEMRKLRVELEELYDPEMEKKALSSWHGEVNKVFKGDPHEAATFYALMAMSCAEHGEIEDAWRCVQNGLLHDGDAEHERYRSDYALLLSLGAIYCDMLGEVDSAEQCRIRLEDALRLRGAMFDRKMCPKACTEPLFNNTPINAMLVIWTGTSPKFGRGGEYGDVRTVLRGEECPFDFVTVSDNTGREFVVPQRLGDINFQATTRGGREMDNVLKDKADFKDDLHSFKTASRGISGFFFECGNETVATELGSLIAKGGFYAAALTFKIFEGVIFLAFDAVDAHADIRSWKTLPGQLDIIPMQLQPGVQEIVVRGYSGGCVAAEKKVVVKASPDKSIGLVHVCMMEDSWRQKKSSEISELVSRIHKEESVTPVTEYASDNSIYDMSATYSFLTGITTESEQVHIREAMVRCGYSHLYRAGDVKAGTAKAKSDKVIGLLTRNFWLREVSSTNVVDCRIGVLVKDNESGAVSFFHAWGRLPTSCQDIRTLPKPEQVKVISRAAENLLKMPEFRLSLGPKTGVATIEQTKQEIKESSSEVPQQSLKGKAAQLVGTWRCWMEVNASTKTYDKDAVEFADYMPVTGEITIELHPDGSAKVTELEERTFGHSSGTWKYRHGMLEMDLVAENGCKYSMCGVVKWQDVDSFSLQYMINNWRDLMKMRTAGLGDGITAVCQYQNGDMIVTVVRTGEEPKIAERTCSLSIFRRQ